jgi:hypothetical protein
MRRLFGTVLRLWDRLWRLPAEAGEAVVVELYTSQGCSSCPPADALLPSLPREDVIALALHVDYWDYIGWKDDLARPEHTARRRPMPRRRASGMIYTPQFVIGGVDRVTGYEPMEVAEIIQRHRAAPRPVACRSGAMARSSWSRRGRSDPSRGRSSCRSRASSRSPAGRDHARRERGATLRLSQRRRPLGRDRPLERAGHLPRRHAWRARPRSPSSSSATATGRCWPRRGCPEPRPRGRASSGGGSRTTGPCGRAPRPRGCR